MFRHDYDHQLYHIISRDGVGMTLKVPKYRKTSVWIGKKKDVEGRYKVKGRQNFYVMQADDSVVLDGYLTEPASKRVELSVKGTVTITPQNWPDIKAEIEKLLSEES